MGLEGGGHAKKFEFHFNCNRESLDRSEGLSDVVCFCYCFLQDCCFSLENEPRGGRSEVRETTWEAVAGAQMKNVAGPNWDGSGGNRKK